jgi:quercetin dioxygenase-like cupin family protein
MSDQIKNLIDSINMPKQGILSIVVDKNDHFNVTLFMMPKGEGISPHTTTMAATVYVIKGSAIFTLGETDHTVRAGDYFYMPPDYRHAIQATEDFVFLLTLRKP